MPYILLAVVQIADFVLTLAGVHQHGIHAEGNAFVRYLMINHGELCGLCIAKLIGLACVFMLWINQSPNIARGILATYVTFAIIPWMIILS